MIQSLHIEHYALIDRLDICWHPDFSVITGETGAGKSIILGAIGLLLGERAKGRSQLAMGISKMRISASERSGDESGVETLRSEKRGDESGMETGLSEKRGDESRMETLRSEKRGDESGMETSRSEKRGDESGVETLWSEKRGDESGMKASGNEKCVIEAEFEVGGALSDGEFFKRNDLDFDGRHCIVRRELTSEGKSRAFINDTPVNLSLLRELGNELIDIHSQHQNLLLGKEDFQLNILDVLAHDGDDLKKYRDCYSHYLSVRQQLQEARERAVRRHEQEDYLRFQFTELYSADLRENEQEVLEAEQEMLTHAEDIKAGLYEAIGCLNAEDEVNTLQNVKRAMAALRGVSRVFSQTEELSERLDSCFIELKDIADEIERKADEIEYDPVQLERVNARLDMIYTLQKKHHVDSVAALLALRDEFKEQLASIGNSGELVAKLESELWAAKKAAREEAKRLTAMRTEAKKVLELEIVGRLQSLGMPNVRFEVNLTSAELGWKGSDKVEFLFSANKNVAPQPLSQIASGGEIARVMLSLKVLMASAMRLPTIIFDEIDTGVSGKIAEQMATMMEEMGRQGCQVISITHLPQIAAKGRHHYKVYKEEGADATRTHIAELTADERTEEIAHMLSGATLTEAALNNARSLLDGSSCNVQK